MNLLNSFWPKIIQAVTYIRNRSFKPDKITLFEKYNKKKPDINGLKVLNYKIQVKNIRPGKKKLNNKV